RNAIVRPNCTCRVEQRIAGVSGLTIGIERKPVAAGSVPIPIGQREARIANQSAEDLLVEIQVRTVPWKKPPATVYFLPPKAVQCTAAVPTMHLTLVKPPASIIGFMLRQVSQSCVGAP